MIPIKHTPDFEPEESFETYLKKWPKNLSNIPSSIIEQWCYRHNEVFVKSWQSYSPEKWSFRLETFSNKEILKIEHLDGELENWEATGINLLKKHHASNWLCNYMLTNGTFPEPIIVAMDGGKLKHPKSLPGEFMKEPYQLIEGHRRLGILRAMLHNEELKVMELHKVWLLMFNP